MSTTTGTAGNDFLIGTSGDDSFFGLGGHDTLRGDGGNDELSGGDGNDDLFGDAGDDTLLGGDGDDQLLDLYGNDSLVGGLGNDTLLGWLGNDTLQGGDDDDTLWGDQMRAAPRDGQLYWYTPISTIVVSDDELHGGSGNDRLYGDEGNDKLYGDEGNDFLSGGSGSNTLDGGDGNDELYGGDGDDELDGGDGDDELSGNSGDDNLRGGKGNDLLHGDLYPWRAGDPPRTVFAEQNVVGNDTLEGGEGNDTLKGGALSDTFDVDSGTDTVTDLTTIDVLHVRFGATAIVDGVLDFTGFNVANEGTVVMAGTGGANAMVGTSGADDISGGGGNDTLTGGGGNDTLTGGGGNDTFKVDSRTDTVTDLTAGDTLQVAAGASAVVNGVLNFTGITVDNKGTVQMSGGVNADVMTGTNGADIITGGAGDDTLTGGTGADIFNVGADTDTLTDLAAGETLNVSAGATAVATGVLDFSGIGGNNLGTVQVAGTSGSDAIVGTNGVDIITSGAGNDTVTGGAGSDQFLHAVQVARTTVTISTIQIQTFGEWLAPLNLNQLTQSQFSTHYTAWIKHLVATHAELGADLNGDGVIAIGMNQNDPTGLPTIEGMSAEQVGHYFNDSSAITLQTGKTTQVRYLAKQFVTGSKEEVTILTGSSLDGHDVIQDFTVGEDTLALTWSGGLSLAEIKTALRLEVIDADSDGAADDTRIDFKDPSDGVSTWSVTLIGVTSDGLLDSVVAAT